MALAAGNNARCTWASDLVRDGSPPCLYSGNAIWPATGRARTYTTLGTYTRPKMKQRPLPNLNLPAHLPGHAGPEQRQCGHDLVPKRLRLNCLSANSMHLKLALLFDLHVCKLVSQLAATTPRRGQKTRVSVLRWGLSCSSQR